jgi:hypothetical protein
MLNELPMTRGRPMRGKVKYHHYNIIQYFSVCPQWIYYLLCLINILQTLGKNITPSLATAQTYNILQYDGFVLPQPNSFQWDDETIETITVTKTVMIDTIL